MALRTTYASLADGLQPMSLFDQSLADVGNLGIIPCTATGTNAIALSPVGSVFAPTVTTPQALQAFSFVAVGNSSAPVTIQIGSTAALKLYRSDGTTQATTGDLKTAVLYCVSFNSALNSGAGGFQIAFPVSSLVVSGATITGSAISGGTISGATITTSTYNGNIWTVGTGTLTIAAGKTETFNNTMTFAGIDGALLTFQGSDTYVGRATADTLTNKSVDLGSNTLTYSQTETGAVSSPMISRFTNTLFAHEFGAIGDDTTNDATALQAFLTAVAASGKEGRFDPGKSYFVSGADLLLGQAIGVKNTFLYGNGAQIRTDPTQFRAGLTIQRTPPVSRADETRKILVDGLRISQFQDANALWGFQVIGSTFVTLRNCTVICGSDNATVPQGNYAAYRFMLSNPVDPNTGSFWCSMDTCAVKGAVTPTPNGLRIDGQCNAMHVTNCTFANATEGVLLVRASTGANANEAGLANGVRITNCDFEGGTDAIATQGTAGWSTLPGLIVSGCRAESLTTFFRYSLDTNPSDASYPILGPNYLATSVVVPISNPNFLPIDVRDEIIGKVTFTPAALAANTTRAETTHTITTLFAAATDMVTVQVGGDLQGITATAYVSAANTVTIRLTNPTSGSVTLGSLVFTVRVRRFF